MFERRSLNWKMRMAFTVSAISLAIVGYFSFKGLNEVQQKYAHVADVNLPNSMLVESMKSSSDKAMSLMIQSAIVGNDEKEVKRLRGRYDDTMAKFDNAIAEYQKVIFSSEERAVYDVMMNNWQTVLADLNKGRELAVVSDPTQKHLFQEFYMSTKSKMLVFNSIKILMTYLFFTKKTLQNGLVVLRQVTILHKI